MRVFDEGYGGGLALLHDEPAIAADYYELLDVLGADEPDRHGRRKSRPEYVFDQTGLIKRMREELTGRGWRQGQQLWPINGRHDGGLNVRADMTKGEIQAIFEFGNRASYAYNLITRVMLGVAGHNVRLSVLVTPTLGFASRIDSNLASFERATAELARLEALMPAAVPGAIMIVGVEPTHG